MVLVRRKGVVLGGGGGAGEKRRGVGGWCIIFGDFRWEGFGFVVEWWNFVGLKIVAFVGFSLVSRLCGCCCFWG